MAPSLGGRFCPRSISLCLYPIRPNRRGMTVNEIRDRDHRHNPEHLIPRPYTAVPSGGKLRKGILEAALATRARATRARVRERPSMFGPLKIFTGERPPLCDVRPRARRPCVMLFNPFARSDFRRLKMSI